MVTLLTLHKTSGSCRKKQNETVREIFQYSLSCLSFSTQDKHLYSQLCSHTFPLLLKLLRRTICGLRNLTEGMQFAQSHNAGQLPNKGLESKNYFVLFQER